jgi:D-arabinose 1-dehydrogenase-like Zn-dependent alcohol dehydrogenase
LQALESQFQKPAPIGLIPSHEVAGTVAKLGSKYKGKFQVGDRVGVLNFKHACGTCVGCKLRKQTHGDLDPRICELRETAGFLHDGWFADYMAADPAATVLLPESVPFDQAAPLMCAGATVWGSLERTTAGLPKGSAVAVVGIGGLGRLGLRFAKAMGFKIIAVDNRKAGRSLAADIENVALTPDLVYRKHAKMVSSAFPSHLAELCAWFASMLRYFSRLLPMMLMNGHCVLLEKK